MDPRHVHHTCHHHNQNSHPPLPPPRFPRYGVFPSRIFPPTSSSSSSTASDIRTKTRWPLQRKTCAKICLAIIFVGIGAAAGIYFGYQFLSLTPAIEQIFRGSFSIIEGDIYSIQLSNPLSPSYKYTAKKYKTAIDAIYGESVLKNAFLGSEILAFDGVEGGSLKVQFNIHVDTHRIRLDAGDLFITLAEGIRNGGGQLPQINATIDQDSLEIQERNMEFLYLPSTERTQSTVGLTSFYPDDNNPTTSTHKITQPPPPQSQTCQPMNIRFCQSLNTTAFSHQRMPISDEMLEEFADIVKSGCHPSAVHFLCSWASCRTPDPCMSYCQEFMSSCGHLVSKEYKSLFNCENDDGCTSKPGCVEKLYTNGQGRRVCDGNMDCETFEDEINCPYCSPGHFHCGAGKQCIPPEKKCNGKRDCGNGSDEKACLQLAPSSEAAAYVHQYFNEGYLFVHDQGKLGKLCVEKRNGVWNGEPGGLLHNIATSACELLGYRKVSFVKVTQDTDGGTYVRIEDPGPGASLTSEVTFATGKCESRKVLYVGCNHLECGQRPSYVENELYSNVISHGDFPWHALLFKNNEHVCDATLITSQWLLTTLACFGEETKAKWTVHFGRVRLGSSSPWSQERRIVGMVKSPLGDNLVLIKMASPIIFSDFARHACLPEDNESVIGIVPWAEKPLVNCIRLGWNKEDEVIETRMSEVSSKFCSGPYPWSRNNSRPALCLETTSLSLSRSRECNRGMRVFPGAPIVCQNEGGKEWVLGGVSPTLSYPKCGIEKYRVTRVGGSTEWILRTIQALNTIT